MRRLLLGLICAAAWSQTLPLDCGQSQALSFNPGTPRYNLTFSGQVGELVLIRYIYLPVGAGHFANPPVLRDQFGNRVAARTPETAPLDIIGTADDRIGFHYDLPGDGIYTLEVTSAVPSYTGTVPVALA